MTRERDFSTRPPGESGDYEVVKRVLKRIAEDEGYVAEGQQFLMACERCGMPMADGSELKDMLLHTRTVHGSEDVRLDMVWLDPGPPPKKGRRASIRRR